MGIKLNFIYSNNLGWRKNRNNAKRGEEFAFGTSAHGQNNSSSPEIARAVLGHHFFPKASLTYSLAPFLGWKHVKMDGGRGGGWEGVEEDGMEEEGTRKRFEWASIHSTLYQIDSISNRCIECVSEKYFCFSLLFKITFRSWISIQKFKWVIIVVYEN